MARARAREMSPRAHEQGPHAELTGACVTRVGEGVAGLHSARCSSGDADADERVRLHLARGTCERVRIAV